MVNLFTFNYQILVFNQKSISVNNYQFIKIVKESMANIAANLKEIIKKQPNELFNVIVVSAPKANLKADLKPIEGLDDMYSGALTGKKILAFEKSKKVLSIEPDGEMKALKK